jgi:predicted transcriptional regulator
LSKLITIIFKSSNMLYFMIKDLLDLLKIQNGTFETKMSTNFNPTDVGQDMLNLFSD